MPWKFTWPTFSFGAAAASLGAIIHAVVCDGGASLTQFGVGGTLAAGAIALLVKMHTAWKAAGGKFDGKMSDAEARALIGSAAAELKLSPAITTAAEKFAPQAAQFGNQLIGRLEQTVPSATELIGLISRYLSDPTDDPDHNALLWKFVDVASQDITGDVLGEDAAALLRQRLDFKLFPGTPAP